MFWFSYCRLFYTRPNPEPRQTQRASDQFLHDRRVEHRRRASAHTENPRSRLRHVAGGADIALRFRERSMKDSETASGNESVFTNRSEWRKLCDHCRRCGLSCHRSVLIDGQLPSASSRRGAAGVRFSASCALFPPRLDSKDSSKEEPARRRRNGCGGGCKQ